MAARLPGDHEFEDLAPTPKAGHEPAAATEQPSEEAETTTEGLFVTVHGQDSVTLTKPLSIGR